MCLTYLNHIPLFLLFTGYTFFALFEYLVVFSNMAFHLTAVWDFKTREVMVISSSEEKDFWLETQGLSAKCTTTQPPDDNCRDPAQEEEWHEGLFHIFPWWTSWVLRGCGCQTNFNKRSTDLHMCYYVVYSVSCKCICMPQCLIHGCLHALWNFNFCTMHKELGHTVCVSK